MLTRFETFAHLGRVFSEVFLCEFGQESVLLDQISVFVDVVHDHVDESDTSAGVLGELPHEENVFRHFVLLQGGGFSSLEVLLQLVDLV